MTAHELLKLDAEYAWKEVSTALEGVTQGQAWAMLPNNGPDYLHTDATIQGIVLHIAAGKWMYGSICFRDTELRWQEVADQMEAFEPSWEGALDYLRRGHEYWMSSWASFTDVDEIRPTYWKEDRPVWKILQIVNQHDSYHAGQIAMLRYAVGESEVKPASYAEDIRTHCKDTLGW